MGLFGDLFDMDIFDLDGTLFCESDPTWFDFMMYKHRILEDSTYKDQATEYILR